MKRCTKCLQEKPITSFWKDNRGYGDGRGSRCKECNRLDAQVYRSRRRDKEKARYWKNPDAARNRHLRRKYAIDLIAYGTLLIAQEGCCAICGTAPRENRLLDVDHDHATGIIRGLLCSNCNRILGYAHDDPSILQKAVVYLEQSPLAAVFIRSFLEAESLRG